MSPVGFVPVLQHATALLNRTLEPPVQPGREEARRWAAEKLSKREYREAAPGWLETLWQQFLDWLQSVTDGQSPAEGPPVGPFIGLGIAILIAVAIILARPRLNARRRPPKEIFDAEAAATAADYRERAKAAAARGDWAAAVVEQFRALVSSAEDRAVLDPQPGRTADEAAGQLIRAFPAASGRLEAAARMFDAVRYGSGSAVAADHAAVAGLDSTLERLTPSYAGAAPGGLAVPR
ncbi:DUF4129 domain-containing protein [Arthrobacter globiformis]|uniref:DUF4129 domain-containing protein n=1 Tax=Arthrobacter globiformis TaxID=1665 RepID=A0A328H996_ARTGO|nr:DUF4129 domain-containing protein [Arthrobacter globiformis]RAM35132.1 DUF4129 domain-containing protein [Arthrobacter globiformis]